jgi:hypothetical protein
MCSRRALTPPHVNLLVAEMTRSSFALSLAQVRNSNARQKLVRRFFEVDLERRNGLSSLYEKG